LKQVQGNIIKQCRIIEQEKIFLQDKFEGEKAHMQQEKENLLPEQLEVKEAVNRALHSMIGLELQCEDRVMHQVEKIAEALQQLQQQITYLELHIVPSTPQDVREQREEIA
jgi:hypothetical protein